MSVLLLYKFHLFRILPYFCLQCWFIDFTPSGFCNISAYNFGLKIPPLKDFAIFMPVMLVYIFHLLSILQYFWDYDPAGGTAENEENCLN